MKTIFAIATAFTAAAFMLSACGGSAATPPALTQSGDTVATPTVLVQEAILTKVAVVKIDATPETMVKAEVVKQADPTTLAKGEFTKVDASHFANGQARIDKSAAGELILHFTNFNAAPGPDLYVVLSGHPQPANSGEVMGSGHLELARLQNSSGDQNYALPAGFDAGKFKSVVIYCKQFSFIFSTATLTQ